MLLCKRYLALSRGSLADEMLASQGVCSGSPEVVLLEMEKCQLFGGKRRKEAGMAGAQVRRGTKVVRASSFSWRGKRQQQKPQAIGGPGGGHGRAVCEGMMYLSVVGRPPGRRVASQVNGRQMGKAASWR